MRIYEMTATFGKLDGETLRLKPGMNYIVAPNEWGKSTWCAFLTAMFYGINTRERSTREYLAEKERYAPWSGKPMEGLIHLEHQGQYITIQRRTRGRIPMGDFSAIDARTGLPIPGLTGDNCGQVLLGVEKSVFLRSGFIRLQEMPVTQDEALRRRLNALVTTGDDSGAADNLSNRLKELKNRCRYNRSGLIPQTSQHLEELREQLQQRQALDSRLSALLEKEKQTQKQLEELENHKKWLEYNASRQAEEQLQDALKAEDAAFRNLEQVKNRCQKHPSRQELEARLVAQEEVVKEEKPGRGILIAGFIALAAAVVLGFLELWLFAAVAGGAAALLLVFGIIKQRRFSQWEKDRSQRFAQREQWLRALADWDELERGRQEVIQARHHAETIRSMIRQVPRPEAEDALDLSMEQTAQAVEAAWSKLGQYRQLRGECLGRMESLPQAQNLEQQIRGTSLRLKELEKTYTALGYAQKALEEATDQLQRRFAPKITRRAQELLARMTGGRYEQLLLNRDLELQASARDEVTRRGTIWRSDGTADQMYLALRIAVWEELMPEGPLVLDDALVRFDQQRLNAAMTVLEDLSKDHQVIVFACR